MAAAKFSGEYVAPTLTVDDVIFQISAKQLQVLLIRRANAPFRNHWALPGAYCAAGETTVQTLSRIWRDKAGVAAKQINYFEQLYTFDTVARDPRGHAVSVSYLCLANDLAPANDPPAQQPTWFAVDDLPKLAFDHREIIRLARARLASKITYTNVIFALLPREFTLSELQTAHEAVFGRELDKRNFRKKFLSFNFIAETGAIRQNGAHRPAKLYEFTSRKLQEIAQSY